MSRPVSTNFMFINNLMMSRSQSSRTKDLLKRRPIFSSLAALSLLIFSFWAGAAEKPGRMPCSSAMGIEGEIPIVNLRLLRFFPSDQPEKENLFFSQLWSIDADSSKHIALLDMNQAKIYIFFKDGRLRSKFGQKGQGPGEFSFPRKVGFYHGSLFVFDPGGHRLQFFDLDGKLLRSVKLVNSYLDVIISEDGKIFCTRRVGTEETRLVEVMDENGTVLHSFGEPIKVGQLLPGLLNEFKITGLKDRSIMISSQTTGNIRIYDFEGHLVQEVDCLKEYLKEERATNLKSFSDFKPGRSPILHLFEAVRVSGQSIYFLRSKGSFYELIELNRDYKISRRFQYRTRAELSPDFAILPSEGPAQFEIFLIELTSETNRVLVIRTEMNLKN